MNVRINPRMEGDPALDFIDLSRVTNDKNDERMAEQQKKFQQHLDKMLDEEIIDYELDRLNSEGQRW